jgi:hypothetical protein
MIDTIKEHAIEDSIMVDKNKVHLDAGKIETGE